MLALISVSARHPLIESMLVECAKTIRIRQRRRFSDSGTSTGIGRTSEHNCRSSTAPGKETRAGRQRRTAGRELVVVRTALAFNRGHRGDTQEQIENGKQKSFRFNFKEVRNVSNLR